MLLRTGRLPQPFLGRQYGRVSGPRSVRCRATEPSDPATPAKDAAPAAADAPPAPTTEPRTPAAKRTTSSITALSRDKQEVPLVSKDLLRKLAILVFMIAVSRIGVYDRLPGVDVEKFSAAVSDSGVLGYIDNLTGGSISNVGVFSLGIIPAINASIFLQILTVAFPGLKKLQREEGPQGRARFSFYQKLATLGFATLQAFGQLSAIQPYVTDSSAGWLLSSAFALIAGAMIVNQLGDYITEQKLGNGTSILIFANIASFLPSSVVAAFSEASAGNAGASAIAIYLSAFLLTTFGIVCVQGAERRVPINYASRFRTSRLEKQAYMPFKVNATGVMPVIFSTSLLALPSAVARFANIPALAAPAAALTSGGALYVPANVLLIVAINYYYTFLQLDPNDVAEQLKRQGASMPGVRPGRATADFVTQRLTNMSVLGSIFLGVLAAAPSVVEALTSVPALRGFAGTSVLIIVGVATDTARRIRAERQMSKYGDVDSLYDSL